MNVGVQTSSFCDEHKTKSKLKLPAKKRHGKFLVEEAGSSCKKNKLGQDRKIEGSQYSSNSKKKEPKQKRGSEKKQQITRKRKCNPQAWKKNIRKTMRVQGKGYINTRGVYVPPKSRSGPPCACRMRCFETIPEEECNEIFKRFLQIGDKNIQDALLYSLITKEEPKHRRAVKNNTPPYAPKSADGQSACSSNNKQNLRNATFFYHVQCNRGIERVCSTAFMSIYGATQKRVRRLQMHKFIDPLNPPKDLRGKHGNQKLVG